MTWAIRPATAADNAAILAIILPVIRAGETYTLDSSLPDADALAYWLSPDKRTYVAEDQGDIVGTYYLRANQDGGGRHVCNCGYMTSGAANGRGVARRMCAHSMEQARALGYLAMQFNFVVSSNDRAVRLWESLGFVTIGTQPDAFRHPRLGLVDALVMHRRL